MTQPQINQPPRNWATPVCFSWLRCRGGAINTFYSGLITSGSGENVFHVKGARDHFFVFYLFFYPNRQPASVKQRAHSAEMKVWNSLAGKFRQSRLAENLWLDPKVNVKANAVTAMREIDPPVPLPQHHSGHTRTGQVNAEREELFFQADAQPRKAPELKFSQINTRALGLYI